MSNFTFLNPEWPAWAASAAKVEQLAHPDPRAACFYACRTLELAMQWLYANDPLFHAPYDRNLSALIHEPSFKANVPPQIFLKAKAIKDLGNLAVHSDRPMRQYDAVQAATELFHFLFWVARTYANTWPVANDKLIFDPKLLIPAPPAPSPQTAEQLSKLAQQLKAKDEALAEQKRKLAETDAQVAQLREQLQAQIAAAKQRTALIPDDHDYSEAQTRDFFIDLLLREAGWPLDKPEDREYPVLGMPNTSGEGFVDYVFWGDDGLPLAIVEAKRTKKDPRIGQQQAKLYADCLEAKFKQRPIIFYTNAYETWIWDDAQYPPRPVQGFYKKDELQLLIQRRAMRQDLATATINTAIVERAYQTEAIRNVTESLTRCHRKALIVMATGAGKTRTVIALCDLLQRCNWVKRMLFLADRTALVNQAVNAFKKHLPDTAAVNLVTEREKEKADSRVLVSTYPTMMNLIDETSGDMRHFGPGHFDLVIIDEAHRSVYQKYKAIFEYFDSLLVGLTATPRDEVDRDTYHLFDLEAGIPTFAYELQQAVSDGFLVPPRPISVPLRFVREGITYDDLSDAEKEQWDRTEWDEETGEVPDEVDPEALNKWLFNTDTVDQVLKHLMTHGQKVAGGDRLGKTIIFAKNHKHAEFIQKRFDINYPHHKGVFARVIDHFEPYAQSLIDTFSIKDKPPHIAISVDMLDTGIDVPEVVNLVFFKIVRSKTKFFQMIGRGTRLCKDLFGPDQDKQFFYIFDYCQNLEFFNQNAQGIEGQVQRSLGEQLFRNRLEITRILRTTSDASPPIETLCREIFDTLHAGVASMNLDNFVVRTRRRDVETYADRAAWDALQGDQYIAIGDSLAALPTQQEAEDEIAKRFDLLMLKLQLAVLGHEPGFEHMRDQVMQIGSGLEEKQSIPMVKAQLALILEIQTEEYWQDVTLPTLDDARKRLRDLVQFIDKKQRKIVYTHFTDQLGEHTPIDLDGLQATADLAQYKKKMLQFLHDHENHIVLRKLKLNEPITPSDLAELDRLLFESSALGDRQTFKRAFGKQPSLSAFIRTLVGLDRNAAKTAFAEYLSPTAFNSNQIRFINLIIDELTKTGIMPADRLYESPYTDYSPSGLDGLFDNTQALKITSILTSIQNNAVA